jgi:single-strand DNA-binding protein
VRTTVTIVGNLTTPPRLRITKDGDHVADFGLAHNDRRRDRQTGLWEDSGTTFYTVTCWRKVADAVASCLQKGDAVVVHGPFTTHEFERRDGTAGLDLRIEGQAVGPDLARVMASVLRMPRPAQPSNGTDATAEAARPGGALLAAVTDSPRADEEPADRDESEEPEFGTEPEFEDDAGTGVLETAPAGSR